MERNRRNEFRAALALKHTPQLGPRSWKGLLEACDGAYGAYRLNGHWPREVRPTLPAIKAFRAGEYREAAAAEFENASRLGLDVVLWTDPDYPERLRHVVDPPLFLYCAGRRDLLRGPSVAVVGSRRCSTRGLALASRICEGLSAAGVTVVSGMAKGIDRQAHLSGLAGPGSSIAVLGTGLDVVYPAANSDLFQRLCAEGLVLTEFAPGTPPLAAHFPYRNRIVSGLSLGVVVVEAALRSGSRITARLGLEQGREVYAVPPPGEGDVSQGCDELVEQGARPVTSAGEVILDLAALIKADAERMRDARAAVPRTQLPLEAVLAPPADGGGDGERGEDAEVADAAAASGEAAAAQAESPASQPRDTEAATPMADASPPSPPIGDDPDQRAVIERLADGGQAHIDQLARDLGWDVGRLSRTLAVMEVLGLVRQWPGMRYGLA